MPPSERPLVLHYVGAEDDYGGIVSVIRSLATAHEFDGVLGVNPGFVQHRPGLLPTVQLPRTRAEVINLATFWRARTVAQAAAAWLAEEPRRVFHGHSRAGLLTALWLRRHGESRVVVSVHCYGRQRWFYRWASRRLGARIRWLTPRMKTYYSVEPHTWDGCIPNSVPALPRSGPRAAVVAGRLSLGGAGMLVRWKQWHLVLEALAALPAEQRSRVSFRHIGTADSTGESRRYAEELKQRTRELGLSEIVQWLGWQSSSAELLSQVDAVIVPATREPFSMIALEALFSGVPVIAADDGGPADLLAECHGGWLFRAGSSAEPSRVIAKCAMTDACPGLKLDPEALRRFSTSVVSAQWAAVYHDIDRGR